MITTALKPTKLTARQQQFCQEYVLGEHRGNAARSYQAAYGKTGSPSTAVRVNACRLLQKPQVQRELEKLRAEVRRTEKLTREMHMARLAMIRDEAWTKRQFSAAVRAEELRGKAMGFYGKRPVAPPDQMDREEMSNRVRHLLTTNARLRELVSNAETSPGDAPLASGVGAGD